MIWEHWIAYSLTGIYAAALLMIFLYSLSQLHLMIYYLRSSHGEQEAAPLLPQQEADFPMVTIQLPVFNEMYVMERLLENISKIDYPHSRLQIQVLDDSTDESVQRTAELVRQLQSRGLDIVHHTRKDRSGFKAGALKEGLQWAKGELIAIFDADFMPEADWLKRTVPYFRDPGIGVVQTRWGHLNRDYSLLTRIQAFALDAHFTIEQAGRNALGHFINFNGTAGIWRKACILDAGNWEGDTLTEDLDLSYRAQLRKWKFKYLEAVETPAELPVAISAARSQQFRWNKGGAENFRKSALRLIRARHLPLGTRIHGLMHLLNSSMFLFTFLIAVLSIPMLYIKHSLPQLKPVIQMFSLFLVSTLILFITYWIAYKNVQGGGWHNFKGYFKLFISFFTVVLGFSLHNSIAVLEGHLGKKSEFIRTPKFNILQMGDSWKNNRYLSTQLTFSSLLEGFMALYFIFGMISAWILKDFGLFPFHLMLFLGFGYVFYQTLKPRW